MNKVSTNELLQINIEQAKQKMHTFQNPKIVQVAMLVDVDEYGRISQFSPANISHIHGLIDDSKWPYKPGQSVYHRTLKQIGEFVEVDQLDPSSATVKFVEDDGYVDEKRISLELLTDQIPEENVQFDMLVNGITFTAYERTENRETITYVKSKDLNVEASVNARLTIQGEGAVQYKHEILTAVIMYENMKRKHEQDK